MTREELDGIRRSLAIGGSLTRSDIDQLLEVCDRLLAERGRIEAILRQLGPVWTDARAALNELHAILRRPGAGQDRVTSGARPNQEEQPWRSQSPAS